MPADEPKLIRSVAALAAVLIAVALIATLPDYGLTIDEATHIWVAREVRQWFAELPDRGITASLTHQSLGERWHFLESPSGRAMDRHSNFNLPVTDHLMNLGWLATHRFVQELTSYRLAITGLFAITVYATIVTLARQIGSYASVFAGIGIAATPRVFGHAHLAATETPLCCLWTLALLALCRRMSASDKDRTRWTWISATAIGLALATKMTAWLLAMPLLVWLAWNRPAGSIRLLLMVGLVSLAAIVALTPPLWHHPIRGLWDTVRETADNPWRIWSYYLGVGYEGEMPVISALVIVAVTTPVGILILSLAGLLAGLAHPWGRLFILNAATVLGLRVAGLMPQHDMERQFLPYFYFAPIIAAFGLQFFLRQKRAVRAVMLLVAGVALVEAIGETWLYRRHALSYFNRTIGGLRGADKAGMEISYWFESATDEVWRDFLDERTVPRGSAIFLRPDHPGLSFLQERGLWRDDLRSTGPEEADFYLLTARRSAYLLKNPADGRLYPTDLLRFQRHAPAIKERRFLDVRLIGLFKRP